MDRKVYLPEIISKFENWYQLDEHKENINYYEGKITGNYIRNLGNNDFVDFFYAFISEGGKIQSGGERSKNQFRTSIITKLDVFREFVLEPFSAKFDLKLWLNNLDEYKYFGIGIATIYLNRINNSKFSVFNNKTIKALRELGFDLTESKNFTNYEKVNSIQLDLIRNFPSLQNLYKTDALNHFVVGTSSGRQLLINYVYKELIEDGFEQDEVLDEVKDVDAYDDKDKILRIIRRNEKDKSETIIINMKTYKRSNFLMALIKKYRNFECQFCQTKILKENGDYYIEACHIDAKAHKGKDKLNNILILCPNCHKLFDHGKRELISRSDEYYIVELNGKRYEASLK